MVMADLPNRSLTVWRGRCHPGPGEALPRRKSKSCMHFGSGQRCVTRAEVAEEVPEREIVVCDHACKIEARCRWNRLSGTHNDWFGQVVLPFSVQLLHPKQLSAAYSARHPPWWTRTVNLLFTTRDGGEAAMSMTATTAPAAISHALSRLQASQGKAEPVAVTSCKVCVRRASSRDLVACKP